MSRAALFQFRTYNEPLLIRKRNHFSFHVIEIAMQIEQFSDWFPELHNLAKQWSEIVKPFAHIHSATNKL